MRMRARPCRECGQEFQPNSPKAEFCSVACKRAMNNRRAVRGAEFYDLYMAHRFERDEAQKARVLSAMNRLASDFREQDRRERAGRKSWQPFRRIFDAKPYLKAIRLGYMRAGR